MTIPSCEKIIEKLEAFMRTKAYADRQVRGEADLIANAASIVAVVPDSDANVALLLQLHGARFVLAQNLNEFETNLESLRAKLLEMKERQTTPE